MENPPPPKWRPMQPGLFRQHTTSQRLSSTTSLAKLRIGLRTTGRSRAAENGAGRSSARTWRRLGKAAWMVATVATVAGAVAVADGVVATAADEATQADSALVTLSLPRSNGLLLNTLTIRSDTS